MLQRGTWGHPKEDLATRAQLAQKLAKKCLASGGMKWHLLQGKIPLAEGGRGGRGSRKVSEQRAGTSDLGEHTEIFVRQCVYVHVYLPPSLDEGLTSVILVQSSD